MQGEWRHRLSNGQYTIKVAGIDQDANDLPDTVNDRDKFDGLRGSVEIEGTVLALELVEVRLGRHH